MRIAVCGGAYSNPHALRAFCADARERGAEKLYCLGDLGGYGAEPEAIWDVLIEHQVTCVAGNYDVAIAAAGQDCGCGYRDPRDQQYAQIMYDYTLTHTSRAFAAWMGTLPTERREHLGGCDAHFVHGSPLGVNDFWWESLSASEHSLRAEYSGADVVFATHSGLPWQRRIGSTLAVNVGVVGRPANDGTTEVCYALADIVDGAAHAEIIPLRYDWQAQATSMREAGLPEAFVRTTETGWWTTCLEILPIDERSRGRYHVYDSSGPMLLAAAGLPSAAWPSGERDIPVRSLLGTPLFPARLWITDPALRTPLLIEEAARAGIHEIRDLRDGPQPPFTPALPDDTLLPELTASPAGWHWSPSAADGPLLSGNGDQGSGRDHLGVHAAVTSAVRELLVRFEALGALAPPRYCVS